MYCNKNTPRFIKYIRKIIRDKIIYLIIKKEKVMLPEICSKKNNLSKAMNSFVINYSKQKYFICREKII